MVSGLSFAPGCSRCSALPLALFTGVRRKGGVRSSSSPTLEGEYPICLRSEPSHVWWSRPLAVDNRRALFRRPTGDRATFSDVHRNLVLFELAQQLACGRHPEALQELGVVFDNQVRSLPYDVMAETALANYDYSGGSAICATGWCWRSSWCSISACPTRA